MEDIAKEDIAKKVLFEQFISQFRSLSDLINKIPFHPALKTLAIQNFDTGFLWMKEAFLSLDLSTSGESNTLPVNDTQVNPDSAA